MSDYCFYIMSSYRVTLYAGVTNDLERRMYEHRQHLNDGFTSKYRIKKLLYYETTDDIGAAIAREKQIKGWTRRKKVALIESSNPMWIDLAEEWYRSPRPPQTLHSVQGDRKDSGEIIMPAGVLLTKFKGRMRV